MESDASGSAAEVHGALSGRLCMDSASGHQPWLDEYFGSGLAALQEASRSRLHQLFEQTRQQLADFEFAFAPLLPDDEAALADRAQALGEWCHGFLQGMGYTGKAADWPGECGEILQDFVEIVRLDPDSNGEADETAYAELTEYVRVGVQVIHSALRAATPPQRH